MDWRASTDVADYVRMSEALVERTRRGAPLSTAAKALTAPATPAGAAPVPSPLRPSATTSPASARGGLPTWLASVQTQLRQTHAPSPLVAAAAALATPPPAAMHVGSALHGGDEFVDALTAFPASRRTSTEHVHGAGVPPAADEPTVSSWARASAGIRRLSQLGSSASASALSLGAGASVIRSPLLHSRQAGSQPATARSHGALSSARRLHQAPPSVDIRESVVRLATDRLIRLDPQPLVPDAGVPRGALGLAAEAAARVATSPLHTAAGLIPASPKGSAAGPASPMPGPRVTTINRPALDLARAVRGAGEHGDAASVTSATASSAAWRTGASAVADSRHGGSRVGGSVGEGDASGDAAAAANQAVLAPLFARLPLHNPGLADLPASMRNRYRMRAPPASRKPETRGMSRQALDRLTSGLMAGEGGGEDGRHGDGDAISMGSGDASAMASDADDGSVPDAGRRGAVARHHVAFAKSTKRGGATSSPAGSPSRSPGAGGAASGGKGAASSAAAGTATGNRSPHETPASTARSAGSTEVDLHKASTATVFGQQSPRARVLSEIHGDAAMLTSAEAAHRAAVVGEAKSRRGGGGGAERKRGYSPAGGARSAKTVPPHIAVGILRTQFRKAGLPTEVGGGRRPSVSGPPDAPGASPDVPPARPAPSAVAAATISRQAAALQFNTSTSAQLFYGSIVALESLDGWFLTVHHQTGIVSVREPEPRWQERGFMPFRRRKLLGSGSVREVPCYLFKVLHLQNPLANGPVRYGDPIWLQVTPGRGDDGWRSGSVLAPYVHLAVGLDAAGVDIHGHPHGYYTHMRQQQARRQLEVGDAGERAAPVVEAASAAVAAEGSADDLMFGLPSGKIGVSITPYAASATAGSTKPAASATAAAPSAPVQRALAEYSVRDVARDRPKDEAAAHTAVRDALQSPVAALLMPVGGGGSGGSSGMADGSASGSSSPAQLTTTSHGGGVHLSPATRRTYTFIAPHAISGGAGAAPAGVGATPPATAAPGAGRGGGAGAASAAADGSSSPRRIDHQSASVALGRRASSTALSPGAIDTLATVFLAAAGAASGGGVGTARSAGTQLRVEAQATAVGVGDAPARVRFVDDETSAAAAAGTFSPSGALPSRSGLRSSTSQPPPTPGSTVPPATAARIADAFSHLTLPQAKPLDPDKFVTSLTREVASNARLNPLDRLSGRIGVPRPIVAHVPVPGSGSDYLYGPATSHNRQGVYRRVDPGYDVLYGMANARPLMAGKWQLQDAWKERTADGFIIGGLGIEGAERSGGAPSHMRTRQTVASKAAAEYGLRPKRDPFSVAVDPTSRAADGGGGTKMRAARLGGGGDTGGGADKGDIAAAMLTASGSASSQATPFGAGRNTLGGAGFRLDDGDGSGAGSRRSRTDDSDFVRGYVVNGAEVYLEQEWFYISAAVAEADAGAAGAEAELLADDVGPLVGRRSDVTGMHDGGSHTDAASVGAGSRRRGSFGSASMMTASQYRDGGDRGSIATSRLAEQSDAAADGAAYVRQRPDGVSGGNRRHAFLQPHAPAVAGPYKVEKRGVFRIRLVQASDTSDGSMTTREDTLAMRARAQLRVSERVRLGDATQHEEAAAAAAVRDGLMRPSHGEDRPRTSISDLVDPSDPTAAVNLPRLMRQSRGAVLEAASVRYLSHEAIKFTSPQLYYEHRLGQAMESVRRETAALAQVAQGAARHMHEELRRRPPPLGLSASAAALLESGGRRSRNLAAIDDDETGSESYSSESDGGDDVEQGSGRSSPTGSARAAAGEFVPRRGVTSLKRRHRRHRRRHAHAHDGDGVCKLCEGIGGSPMFAVALCGATHDVTADASLAMAAEAAPSFTSGAGRHGEPPAESSHDAGATTGVASVGYMPSLASLQTLSPVDMRSASRARSRGAAPMHRTSLLAQSRGAALGSRRLSSVVPGGLVRHDAAAEPGLRGWDGPSVEQSAIVTLIAGGAAATTARDAAGDEAAAHDGTGGAPSSETGSAALDSAVAAAAEAHSTRVTAVATPAATSRLDSTHAAMVGPAKSASSRTGQSSASTSRLAVTSKPRLNMGDGDGSGGDHGDRSDGDGDGGAEVLFPGGVEGLARTWEGDVEAASASYASALAAEDSVMLAVVQYRDRNRVGLHRGGDAGAQSAAAGSAQGRVGRR